MSYLLLFGVCFVASLIQGATGFGFSVVSVPILGLVYPVRTIVPAALLLMMTFTAQLAFRLRKHIRIKFILAPILAAFAGGVLGIFLLMSLPIGIFRTAWGSALIVFAVYFAFLKSKIRIAPTVRNGLIAGFFAGVLGGMFNSSGPPLVVYFFSCTEDNREYSAAMQVSFAVSSFFNLIVHLIYGNITLAVVKLTGIGLAAVVPGGLLGLRILSRLSRKHLAGAIYALLAAMGVVQIAMGIVGAG